MLCSMGYYCTCENFGVEKLVNLEQFGNFLPANYRIHRRSSRSGWSGFGRTTFIQGKNETSCLQKASNEQKC